MIQSLDLRIEDTPFDPDATRRVVEVRGADSSRPRYRVWLWLDGGSVRLVDSVVYELHPTFRNPEVRKRSDPNNPRFKVAIWTWGIFEVTAVVTLKNGRRHRLSKQLSYDSFFRPGEWRRAGLTRSTT